MELLKTKGGRVITLLICLMPIALFADSDYRKDQSITISSAYYFPDQQGYELSVDIAPVTYNVIEATNDLERDLGSSWGGVELQATYNFSLTRDFLTGGTALTKDNNLKYSFKTNISPVSMEQSAEVILTPIAFLDFNAGTSLATGWKALGIIGLGLNNESDKLPLDDPFQGVLSQTWLTGTFKFDTAALLSGDTTWKHVVILSSHKMMYRYFSGANQNESWAYQGGTNNFNGFKYNHTSFIGYQMPLILEKAGFLIETDCNLFDVSELSPINDEGWGSDFLKVRLGALFNLVFDNGGNIAIIPQYTNRVRYTDESLKRIHFADREAQAGSPTYWDFERLAIVYGLKL